MKVKELIEALKEMPQEEDVIMFDGPASYTHGLNYELANCFLYGM